MTITITLADADREMTAPSQDALDAGWDWYNAPTTTKQDMIEFCAAHGENLIGEDGLLIDAWAEIAAITRANHLTK